MSLELRQGYVFFRIDLGELSRNTRKPVFGFSDQVLHKPGCAATEDGERLDILDLESREIVLSM